MSVAILGLAHLADKAAGEDNPEHLDEAEAESDAADEEQRLLSHLFQTHRTALQVATTYSLITAGLFITVEKCLFLYSVKPMCEPTDLTGNANVNHTHPKTYKSESDYCFH